MASREQIKFARRDFRFRANYADFISEYERHFCLIASRTPKIFELAAEATASPANTWLSAARAVMSDFDDFLIDCASHRRLTPALLSRLDVHQSELELLVTGRTVQATVPERWKMLTIAVNALGLKGKPFGIVDIGAGPGFLGAMIAKNFPNAVIVGVEPHNVDLANETMRKFGLAVTSEASRIAFEQKEWGLQDVPPIIEGSGRESVEAAIALLRELRLPADAPVIFLNSWTVGYWAAGQEEDIDALVDSDERYARVEFETIENSSLSEADELAVAFTRFSDNELRKTAGTVDDVLVVSLRRSGELQPTAIGVGDGLARIVRARSEWPSTPAELPESDTKSAHLLLEVARGRRVRLSLSPIDISAAHDKPAAELPEPELPPAFRRPGISPAD